MTPADRLASAARRSRRASPPAPERSRTGGATIMATALIVLATLVPATLEAQPAELRAEGPTIQLRGVPFEVKVHGVNENDTLEINGREMRATDVANGQWTAKGIEQGPVVITRGDEHIAYEPQVIPGWLSLLPALLAIGLALLLRQVILALAAGVWIGSLFIEGFNPLAATLRLVDSIAVKAAADSDHASILIFSLLLGGMVGVITASGGGLGLAELVTRRATDARRGQLATWILGVLIFFDDYANSLLVGSSMRPITDRLRVSREKLAFLVDATAAPVSSVALISSWVGVEVGYIKEQLDKLPDVQIDPYLAFLQTLPYRFYPWLMLFFGLVLIWRQRDFGPMLKAERRAQQEGKLLADGAKPASDFAEAMPDATPRWMNAAVPVGTVIATAAAGMYFSGRASCIDEQVPLTLRNIFGNANSYHALLWAAAFGGGAAIISALSTKSLKLAEAMDAWMSGLKGMLMACVILVLAWSLNSVCDELHTAQFVIQAIGSGLPGWAVPAMVFLVAAIVSFATGTSWGTMAILFPLAVPLAHELGGGELHIVLGAISSILAGSVWGDHCSPISDTTIMSSMAASCDHVDHVRTQLAYALTVGFVSLVFGEIGTGLGLYPAWVGLILGAMVLLAVVQVVGREAGVAPSPPNNAVDATGDGEA